MNIFSDACKLMEEQFGQDTIMSLATCVDNNVSVRIINAYYKNGVIYITTHNSSLKMKQIEKNSNVALCKDLFNAAGTATNIGHPTLKKNKEIRDELKKVFCAFYDKHVDENSAGTCILKVNLIKAVAFDKENKYVIDFINETANKTSFS